MKKVILHLISTIRYRFDYAIAQSNQSYYQLAIGHGVRTPLEIVYHMRGLMYYCQKVMSNERTPMDPIQDWDTEVQLFYDSLSGLTTYLEEYIEDEKTLLKMTQGPLADALTHIGQLAMISRINNQALDKENFVHAPIGT